jgi:TolB-like protein
MIKYILFYTILFSSFLFSQQITVAVFEFENNGVSKPELRILIDELQSQLVQIGGYTIVERRKIDNILKEQKFQLSGCVKECLIELGNTLGARQIITGNIGKIGKKYNVVANIIDVETGEFIKSSNFSAEGDISLLLGGMNQIAYELTNRIEPNPYYETGKENNIVNSGQNRQEIIQKWSNGQKKVVVYYDGKGSNEKIIKRESFQSNGKISLSDYPINSNTDYYFNGRLVKQKVGVKVKTLFSLLRENPINSKVYHKQFKEMGFSDSTIAIFILNGDYKTDLENYHYKGTWSSEVGGNLIDQDILKMLINYSISFDFSGGYINEFGIGVKDGNKYWRRYKILGLYPVHLKNQYEEGFMTLDLIQVNLNNNDKTIGKQFSLDFNIIDPFTIHIGFNPTLKRDISAQFKLTKDDLLWNE